LDDRREEEYRADMMESNLRYDNAFDTVLSHTPAMEITEFWSLFGEEHIDLGEGTRLSEAAPAIPFGVSNPMHNSMRNPMHKPQGAAGADSTVESASIIAAQSQADAMSEKPAASAWVTHTDPGSGKEYYHITETDVTQWDKPADMTQEELMSNPGQASAVQLGVSRVMV
jgi:hypothetical protein